MTRPQKSLFERALRREVRVGPLGRITACRSITIPGTCLRAPCLFVWGVGASEGESTAIQPLNDGVTAAAEIIAMDLAATGEATVRPDEAPYLAFTVGPFHDIHFADDRWPALEIGQ